MKAVLLNRILLVLGFLGLFISGFLSLAKVLNANVPCGASGGCDAVTNHPSAYVAGFPVAYIGVIGYAILTLLAIVRTVRGLEQTRSLVMPGYLVAAVGTIASLYYQYISMAVIGTVCWWCLASAVTMVLTLIVYAVLAQAVDDARREELPRDPAGFMTLTGLAAALVFGLAISGVVLANNAKNPTMGGREIKTQNEILIPEDAHIYGSNDAPITIVEFADMYCPACRTKSPELKELVDKIPGKIRLVYRHFPLLQKHPYALDAALLSEVAADEGKFFEFLIAVMKAKGIEEAGVPALYDIARKVGLNVEEAKKRIDDEKDPVWQRVHRDIEASDRMGLQVTPTFLVMTEGKVRHIASSNDIFQLLQSPPYKDILTGK
ncbi:MAG TPA: vitamin K epoxide reductase family protein [Fimbriimonas sp.]